MLIADEKQLLNLTADEKQLLSLTADFVKEAN
jgi:hypothetical protein